MKLKRAFAHHNEHPWPPAVYYPLGPGRSEPELIAALMKGGWSWIKLEYDNGQTVRIRERTPSPFMS